MQLNHLAYKSFGEVEDTILSIAEQVFLETSSQLSISVNII